MEQYRSLKDHVYDYIAELIDGGRLGGGDKVSEQQICDALNVSSFSLRATAIWRTCRVKDSASNG